MAGVAGRFHGTFSRVLRNYNTISSAQYTKNFLTAIVTTLVPHRDSSFRSSKVVRDISEYPEVEIHKDPPEWKYVERLLGPVTIPKPEKKPTYPSGWKPPQTINGTQKYFVARTKNFMVPVYLHVKFRGQRRITVVRYVQGDIWNLEQDLRKAIEDSRGGKIVASRVNELSGQIHFHGDHVNFVRDWLVSKGF